MWCETIISKTSNKLERLEFIFADEFCSLLDRITAACISHSIRKFTDKYKTIFILASAHQDILRDLLPDAIVTRDLSSNTNVTYKHTVNW